MANPIQELTALGQSIWYDNIRRNLLENGTLSAMIARGDIRGVTSNPSIFQKAIANSTDYDVALQSLSWAGLNKEQILDTLMIEDIRAAADLFRSLYEASGGGDGFVSLEVNPNLANDTEATIAEAQRLWKLVARPNVMIKIPATQEGIPAIRESIAAGININITLIFSLKRYADVISAYISGLERRVQAGEPIEGISSVASFFVSRVDTKVDRRLEEIIQREGENAELASGLLGKAAVANAKFAYQQFLDVFAEGKEFDELRAQGGRNQRPLWASTSTKNPKYSDVKYVEELIGPDTVNTMPERTLDAFRDHGEAKVTVTEDLDAAEFALQSLADVGISMDDVTYELELEGVEAFSNSFKKLLETVESRRVAAQRQLNTLDARVAARIKELDANEVPERLFAGDGTLWTQDASAYEEIRNRLGWLNFPETSQALIPELESFRAEILQAGFKRALLLGMGGSSLASEVMSETFTAEDRQEGLHLTILDSTDPNSVMAADRWSFGQKCLYILSSKSGTTAEVHAFLAYFWDRLKGSGLENPGERFIAITDPNTPLEKIGRERDFRRVFLADPRVGGRYSALSAFGLVPAALMGIDLERLLGNAGWMAKQSQPDLPVCRNPGMVLGAVLGEAVKSGRDKLTIIADEAVAPFGAWLEQLVAESTGKEGKGIIPVSGEAVDQPEAYGDDRIFVYFRSAGQHDDQTERLLGAGQPVLIFDLQDPYDLGREFYRWEMAIATASAILGINAFNQPNVQESKTRTKEMIADYQGSGSLNPGAVAWSKDGLNVYGDIPADLSGAADLSDVLDAFLSQGSAGDYVAINAYLPDDENIEKLLSRLRKAIRARTYLPVTVGFGPRFLHSTGQLHKGGPNTGLFLEITADPVVDTEIPGQGMTFGIMELAQALGDYQALKARGRRVIRVHLSDPAALDEVVEAAEGRSRP